MKISFGMIFSIFLIVAFLAFAFYAIKNFIGLQGDVQLKQLSEDLQNDVNRVWKSTQASEEQVYSVPKKVTAICFIEDDFANLVIHLDNGEITKTIEHIDLIKTLGEENRLCFEPTDQKLTVVLKKSYGENLVTISK